MKKLFTALIILISATANLPAQLFCFNANGFFENRTPETDAAIAALPGTVYLGIPGGPISKLSQPVAVPKGWGLDDVFTAGIFELYPDEDGSEVTKWLDKEDAQPDHSYLDDCNYLSEAYPGDFGFVYRCNINSTPFEAIQALQKLIDGGSSVYGVVLGSEVYSWLEFDFEKYIALSEPIITAILGYYPFMNIALCAAPNPERRDHTDWNNALQNYRKTHPWIDAIDVHLYIKGESCGIKPDPILMKTGVNYPILTEYFNKSYDTLLNTTSISSRVTTFKSSFSAYEGPDGNCGQAEIWCMEGFTENPSAYFGNTLLGAMSDFRSIVENFDTMSITGLQTGVAPDIYGKISRSNNYDLTTGMLKRTGYFGVQLALEALGAGAADYSENASSQLATSGACFYFWCREAFGGAFLLPAGYEIESITVRRLTGQFLYSSSGSMQYMAKGSDKSYEIDGIDEDVFTQNLYSIPANSFGYITVKLHKIDIIGCTDPTASNYNPDATINSGCIPPPPPPPAVCYKKRWLFRGCKVDKNCTVDNCKQ